MLLWGVTIMNGDTQKLAECYMPLFSLMSAEHNLILLEEEMQDIMEACEKVKENLNKFFEEESK